MNVLLDTCTVIWAASDPDALSNAARELLLARDSAVHVSPASCAEIACLQERGRIEITEHWRTWFDRCLADNGWRVLDITLRIVQEAYALPETFHRDPVDRLIVGTARVHDCTLVTADTHILAYPHVRSLRA